MNYDKALDEVKDILNKYFPVEDISVLSDEDKRRYEQLVAYINNSGDYEAKIKLSRIIGMTKGQFPEFPFYSEDENYYYKKVISIAENAVDVCFNAFQTNNIEQVNKCIDIINDAYKHLNIREVYSPNGKTYVDYVNEYIVNKANELFNLNLSDYSQIDINNLMEFLVSSKMSKLRDEIARLDKVSIILENDERKHELQDELEYIEKQYYGSDTYKMIRFEKEGKDYKELYAEVISDAENHHGNKNREFCKERLKDTDVRLKYLIDKLYLLKSNNIHDYRISKIEEEINNIGELENGLLSSIAMIDGKLDNLVAEASNYLYSSRYLDYLKENAENRIDTLKSRIASENRLINDINERKEKKIHSSRDRHDFYITREKIRKNEAEIEQKNEESKKIDFYREYTKEITEGLSEQQQADLNEWKHAFSVWFGQLDNIFSDYTNNPDILNQIKKGTFNYTKEEVKETLMKKTKEKIIREQKLNEIKKNGKMNIEDNRKIWQDYFKQVDNFELSDIDKYEINNDVDYMFSIYNQYLKLIGEFKEWSKNNTVSIDFDTFLRSFQKENIKKYQDEVLKNAEQAVNLEDASKSIITDVKSNGNSL